MRLALVGDSHTQIVFPALSRLVERAGMSVVLSKPKAGWTAKKHLEQGISQELGQAQPETVVISLGGNNMVLNESYRPFVANIVNAARQAGAKRILWVGPAKAVRQDVEQRHKWTTDWLKKHLPGYGVEFIDARKWTSTGHRDDGVHFYRSTYKKWAEKVASALRSNPPLWGGGLVPRQGNKIIWLISGLTLLTGAFLLFRRKK